MISVKPGVAVIVKGLRPALESNTIPLTSVSAEIERRVILDKPKKAVSADPLGTVAGLQFVSVFQSPDWGLCFHVALPAKEVCIDTIRLNTAQTPVMRRSGVFMDNRRTLSKLPTDVQHYCAYFVKIKHKIGIAVRSRRSGCNH